MKTKTFEYELEIDPSDVKDFNSLVDISRQMIIDENLYMEVEITVKYDYDKGQYFGEPENCYPSYLEIEIQDVICNGIEISELLEEEHFDKMQEFCNTELENDMNDYY